MKRLVIAGGGHAHLHTLRRLRSFTNAGIAVTLVTPDRFHYYSGMGPGVLGGIYRPEEIRIDVQSLAERGGAACLIGEVTGLDPETHLLRLADGTTLPYDALSLNIGSTVAGDWPAGEDIFPVKPITNLVRARQRLEQLTAERSPCILVVGGGAAGVEIAGNARRLLGDRGEITLVAGTGLLGRFPAAASTLALAALNERHITVLEGVTATALAGHVAHLSDGRTLPFDLAFLAGGVKPSAVLRDFGLPLAPDGSVLVNSFLQSTGSPAVFGGGDCVCLAERPLARVGVYAVRQGPVLYTNLAAFLGGLALAPFTPQRSYLQILNLGDGTALMVRNGLAWHGKAAFRLKEYLDRRFVREYQKEG